MMAVIQVFLNNIREPITISGLSDEQADEFAKIFAYGTSSLLFIEAPDITISAYFMRREIAAVLRLSETGDAG